MKIKLIFISNVKLITMKFQNQNLKRLKLTNDRKEIVKIIKVG